VEDNVNITRIRVKRLVTVEARLEKCQCLWKCILW